MLNLFVLFALAILAVVVVISVGREASWISNTIHDASNSEEEE